MTIKVKIEYVLVGDDFLPLDEIRNNLMTYPSVRNCLIEGQLCKNFDVTVEGVVDDNCS
jgi:hypothetical protein